MDASKVTQMLREVCSYNFTSVLVCYRINHIYLSKHFSHLLSFFNYFHSVIGGFLRDNLSLKSPVFYLPPVRAAGSTQQILEMKKLAVPPRNSEQLLTPLPTKGFFKADEKMAKNWMNQRIGIWVQKPGNFPEENSLYLRKNQIGLHPTQNTIKQKYVWAYLKFIFMIFCRFTGFNFYF